MLTIQEAAKIIDISAVRTQHCKKDIEELVQLAKKYRFINVHVLPCWVSTLAPMLKEVEGVYVGSPVGFPSGAHTTGTKLCEARQLIKDGVEEMDIVMNVGKFKSGDYGYVGNELKKLVNEAKGKALTKVIIETNVLTDEEMLKACELVKESGANFVKTGTGWIPGNVNMDRMKKLKACCGHDIKLKAAGGIHSLADFMALYEMGVDRMGINTKSAMEIVETLANM
jgi:deoxyribose-phosphate aldolase